MSDRYPIDRLHEFAARVFARLGVPEDDARLASDVLTAADLRGIDSHGIVRLGAYANVLIDGRVNPRPRLRIVRETACTASVDGDNGLGLVIGPKANALAIKKGLAAGAGWVGVGNSNHFGIAGYYPLQGLGQGLIGWAMTNAARLVAPLGGAARMLGTNPIAFAVPGHEEPPVVIDLATSVVAWGKVQIARREGRPLPDGWAIDKHGRPTTDPAVAFDGGVLLPLGGDRDHGGHKGYCLAALVDLLCGVLTGANWGPFVPPFMAGPAGGPVETVGLGLGHFFGALRIDGFTDPDEFRRRVDAWVRTLRATKPAPESPGVLIPGDPERLAEADRRANGVPLSPEVVAELRAVSERTGVPFE